MTKICKWGNSLGLRLPAPIAIAAGLRSGSRISVRLLDNGSLLITPQSGVIVISEEGRVTPSLPTPDKW